METSLPLESDGRRPDGLDQNILEGLRITHRENEDREVLETPLFPIQIPIAQEDGQGAVPSEPVKDLIHIGSHSFRRKTRQFFRPQGLKGLPEGIESGIIPLVQEVYQGMRPFEENRLGFIEPVCPSGRFRFRSCSGRHRRSPRGTGGTGLSLLDHPGRVQGKGNEQATGQGGGERKSRRPSSGPASFVSTHTERGQPPTPEKKRRRTHPQGTMGVRMI